MKIFNKFPLVRLKQFRDNPRYVFYYLKRLFIYKYTSHKYIENYKDFNFLSSSETLDYLIDNNASLARFGDGDIEQLTGAGEYPPDSDWTQKNSQKLISRLEEVLFSQSGKLLVAHKSLEILSSKKEEAEEKGVVYNMWTDTRRLLFHYLKKGQIYGDAHVFLPEHNPNFNWQKLHNFLKEKDVIIVTGGTAKLFGVSFGKRMFFVEAGKHDAFSQYEKIKQNLFSLIKAENLQKENTLIMASLGPTADILAYELSKEDWTVWDTGHFFKFADKKIRELSKKKAVFTKQLFNLNEGEIERIFQKSFTIYEASLQVEGLVMPKLFSHTKTTLLFERLDLPKTFLEDLMQNKVWQTEWFLRIGKIIGGLHKELKMQGKSEVIHGDLSIHNLALGEKIVFLFDAEPPFLKNKIKLADKTFQEKTIYNDLARFIISLVVGLGFGKKLLMPNRREFIVAFLKAYEKEMNITLDNNILEKKLKAELLFWKNWQLDFGYNKYKIEIKYLIAKKLLKNLNL